MGSGIFPILAATSPGFKVKRRECASHIPFTPLE